MFFTQDDYKKIQQWLIKNSVKDTEFNEANIPFNGNEIVSIVQGNQNKKVFLKDLVSQIFNLGVSDFVNITDKYDAPNISLEEAIRLIPSRARKEGQVITFLDKEDYWHIYQFKGALNQWNVLDTWEDLFDWEKFIIDSILPDEEDLTKSPADTNGNSYLSLKNREYNPNEFSGLGRVILRKNIIEIEDHIYGKVKKNILYQDMINKSNTIYIIQYDYDLNGAEITIPEGCMLDFQGGSLNNGTIKGDNTFIQAALVKIFGLDVELIGDWNISEAYPEWFGAKGDGINDCTEAIQKVLDLFPVVKFSRGIYITTNSLIMKKCDTIVGCSTNQMYSSSVIKYNHSSGRILLSCENSGTPYISISDLHLVGPDPTVENAVYKEGVTCIDTTSGNNVRLNNVWAKNFEYIIYSNYNSYYNKFENCRFENAKYVLYNFSTNNLIVNNCRFLYFHSAILVNGDGPLSVTGSSFEVFNGNIIHFLYNCEQATFMNNYVELYDSYKLPALFPDSNNGYFGGNNLFYGNISRFTSIGNEFQVNGAFRIYWFEALTNFVSIGNHFYVIDGDCNVDAYTVIDNSPKLSNFVALDSLDKRVNTSEDIRYEREYSSSSSISPNTAYNIIGTDPFNGLNFLNTNQYIGMSPNRTGGWWVDDNDPILVGIINNGYFIKGRIVRRKDLSSEASDYLVTLPDVPNVRKNRPHVLYFSCVNSNYDTVVISINVKTREVYLVKGSKDYDIYLDGITIYDMY